MDSRLGKTKWQEACGGWEARSLPHERQTHLEALIYLDIYDPLLVSPGVDYGDGLNNCDEQNRPICSCWMSIEAWEVATWVVFQVRIRRPMMMPGLEQIWNNKAT